MFSIRETESFRKRSDRRAGPQGILLSIYFFPSLATDIIDSLASSVSVSNTAGYLTLLSMVALVYHLK